MNKWNIVLMAFCFSVFAGGDNSIALRDQMLRSLKSLKPATVIPGFTESPREASLPPDEISTIGKGQVAQNKEAKELYQQAEESHAIRPDMNTPDMQLGAALIGNSESAPAYAACGAGQCDNSSNEISDDMNEGITRLGALSGSASEVSSNQVRNNSPSLFKGDHLECEKYILGIRDCCMDSGWGDWAVHCPANLQALQRAKAENRVYYVGSYRKHKLDLEKKHVYCVFPTKLAGIVQLQGRAAQLHIDFGRPKHPKCRGITPEELARINFKSLDLSSLTQEFRSRANIPNASSQGSHNQTHIERLNREGRAHD